MYQSKRYVLQLSVWVCLADKRSGVVVRVESQQAKDSLFVSDSWWLITIIITACFYLFNDSENFLSVAIMALIVYEKETCVCDLTLSVKTCQERTGLTAAARDLTSRAFSLLNIRIQ